MKPEKGGEMEVKKWRAGRLKYVMVDGIVYVSVDDMIKQLEKMKIRFEELNET